jgi:predicted amidophosphoribosyltransferase
MPAAHDTAAAIDELTGRYEGLLLAPRRGPDVCTTCFNLIDGYERCYTCAYGWNVLDAVAPITYSVASEQLHRVLFGYKRLPGQLARRLRLELAAILRRYLAGHERCLARTAGTASFELVTTVPSSDRHRDDNHPLREIVSRALGPASRRHERLLRRTAFEIGEREFDALKYIAARPLDGDAVLLIDDTWTTGANAQSAAAALKAAGAGRVAALVIGRHVHREWHDNDRRLDAVAGRFDWSRCALCAPPGR